MNSKLRANTGVSREQCGFQRQRPHELGCPSYARSMNPTRPEEKEETVEPSERGRGRGEFVKRRGTAGRMRETLRAWKGRRELGGRLRGVAIGSHPGKAVMGWG